MRSIPASIVIVLPLLSPAQDWETMADVPADLAFPVVVELQGNIHVLGGGGNGGASDLHLRYLPATDAWDTLASVPYLAQQPCGAVVDGKIHFCAGGYPNTGTPLDEHWVYDPATDTWSEATALPFPTAINEAAALNGKFYVLSGQPDKQLCQSYDPATEVWTAHDQLPDLNFWYGAVQTIGNTIYRFGGGGYAAPVAFAHAYDVINDAWDPIPSLPMPIHASAGVDLGYGRVCLAGGFHNFDYLDSVWTYDVVAQAYMSAEPLPVGRAYHALVRAGGCVYSVGGTNPIEPAVGFSLLRNCVITSVGSNNALSEMPYTARSTPEGFHLQWTTPSATAHARVHVIDASGRILIEAKPAQGSLIIPSRGLATGAYVVSIALGGRRYVERWMVE